MKFLVNGDFNNNRLLQIILLFVLIYTGFLWFTNILLYVEKIGFTYTSVVDFYLGSDEEFRNPISYRGLLEGTHFHLFDFAIVLLLVNHLTVFSGLNQRLKLLLIAVSFMSGFLDIASGWLIRFVSPEFAYLKVLGFITFQVSFAILLVSSFFALMIYNKH
mgnify:CR=1 FL=1